LIVVKASHSALLDNIFVREVNAVEKVACRELEMLAALVITIDQIITIIISQPEAFHADWRLGFRDW
jgi:hypothetical protein